MLHLCPGFKLPLNAMKLSHSLPTTDQLPPTPTTGVMQYRNAQLRSTQFNFSVNGDLSGVAAGEGNCSAYVVVVLMIVVGCVCSVPCGFFCGGVSNTTSSSYLGLDWRLQPLRYHRLHCGAGCSISVVQSSVHSFAKVKEEGIDIKYSTFVQAVVFLQ